MGEGGGDARTDRGVHFICGTMQGVHLRQQNKRLWSPMFQRNNKKKKASFHCFSLYILNVAAGCEEAIGDLLLNSHINVWCPILLCGCTDYM